MVSIMDVESNRQVCDNRVLLSQSAVSQKSIDLDISLKSIISPTADRDTTSLASVTTSTSTSLQQPQLPCPSSASSPPSASSTTSITASVVAVTPSSCTATTAYNCNATDTDLVKRSMKLNLVDSTNVGNIRGNIPVESTSATSSSASVSASASTTQSTTSTSVVTTTTAIIMKHRKLKERTFSDEIGSPKSPASTTDGAIDTCALMIAPPNNISRVEVVDDRKALRDALYQGIFHRHRRTIFAVGSFLRMLKSRNSSYNTIRSSSEGEDDTK